MHHKCGLISQKNAIYHEVLLTTRPLPSAGLAAKIFVQFWIKVKCCVTSPREDTVTNISVMQFPPSES